MSVLSNLTDKARKQVGVFFIVFAVLAAFTTLPSANEAKSPILYVVIGGGNWSPPRPSRPTEITRPPRIASCGVIRVTAWFAFSFSNHYPLSTHVHPSHSPKPPAVYNSSHEPRAEASRTEASRHPRRSRRRRRAPRPRTQTGQDVRPRAH